MLVSLRSCSNVWQAYVAALTYTLLCMLVGHRGHICIACRHLYNSTHTHTNTHTHASECEVRVKHLSHSQLVQTTTYLITSYDDTYIVVYQCDIYTSMRTHILSAQQYEDTHLVPGHIYSSILQAVSSQAVYSQARREPWSPNTAKRLHSAAFY